MSFLTPGTAVAAALVSVPLLLLLYFLKLRRRTLRVASTMLWLRTFEDLQVNVPFQRLRITTLLILQLLALVLLLIGLAGPVIETTGLNAERTVLLIDSSASMQTRDAPDGRTRLEEAKVRALEIVEDLFGRAGAPPEVLVMTFGRQPRVLTGFERRFDVIDDAIRTIAPTDEEADLDAALRAAGSFAAASDEAIAIADVVILSDGCVPAPARREGHILPAGRPRFVQVTSADRATSRNVGIVDFTVRRDDRDPVRAVAFARFLNSGPEAVELLAVLSADGEPGPTQSVTIPPATPEEPGDAAVTFEIDAPGSTLITLRHAWPDALPADDVAGAILPEPGRPAILLAYAGDAPEPILATLVRDTEPRELRMMSADAFLGDPDAMVETAKRFDLVVLDRVAPPDLLPVPTLTFGAAPGPLGGAPVSVTPPARGGGKRIVEWSRQHPLMRHVSLDRLVYRGFGAFRLPPDAAVLARGPDGPVIAALEDHSVQHVLVGFTLPDSNWITHVSVAVFVQNTLDVLTGARLGRFGVTRRPGDPITVRAAPGVAQILLEGADVEPVPVVDERQVSLPSVRVSGLFRAVGAAAPDERLAVSLLSASESDIRPRSELLINAQTARADARDGRGRRPLTAWFAGAALAGLIIEWLWYCGRLRRA